MTRGPCHVRQSDMAAILKAAAAAGVRVTVEIDPNGRIKVTMDDGATNNGKRAVSDNEWDEVFYGDGSA